MVKLILLIVGAVVILVGTLLFSKKLPRARYRYWDFISLAAVVLGAFAFINLLGPAGTKPEINSIVADDERTEISQTKSARNALLATNLALFIYLGSSQTLNRNGLLIVLFSGYIVYLSSALFYYFWKA